MKKRQAKLPELVPVDQGPAPEPMPEIEVTIKVKGMLWSQFVALLPPRSDPVQAVADLIRLYTRSEYQRRMMEQYDQGMR